MQNLQQKNFQHWHFNGRDWEPVPAQVIVERSVSITVNGLIWLALRCTPDDLEALALGFLYNEGVIQSVDEVADVRPCLDGRNVDVWLHRDVTAPTGWQRTSGCTGGITSHSEENDLKSSAPQLYNGAMMETKQIGKLIGLLFDHQKLYRSSGGVHTSALSDGSSIRILTEDIGRHNTLDKIAGHLLLDNIDFSPRILLTTGRVSSEMLQKSARLGAAVVVSRTSPSSLSIELAQRWGITLIGYARRNRFNVYSHPQRLLLTNKKTSHFQTIKS